ncbi:thioesterase family protein [Nocardia flavorosea]|uniref:Thioesterase n=1 Tax=Nocardia flavorosea TaxID=53429 RepID=A0A846YNQ0_9NOCA|nr:thioesterase family protein [Nocardia flavorosea]NKY60725.1 thioesterase [Nocardia flavorosea]
MLSAHAIPLDKVPQGPVTSFRCRVEESWIDFNDHMNAMYYGIIVYRGQAAFSALIGMGEDYVERTGLGKVVVQSSLGYEHEVRRGDELEIRSWLLGVDAKRIHVLHEVFSLGTRRRVAVGEQLDLNFDLTSRRSSPIPAEQRQYLTEFTRIQTTAGLPGGIGRTVRGPAPQLGAPIR